MRGDNKSNIELFNSLNKITNSSQKDLITDAVN